MTSSLHRKSHIGNLYARLEDGASKEKSACKAIVRNVKIDAEESMKPRLVQADEVSAADEAVADGFETDKRVQGVVVGEVINLKRNLLTWFRLYLCRWRLVHVVCPKCKADMVVSAPRTGASLFRCDKCGDSCDVAKGFLQLQDEYQSSIQVLSETKMQINQQLAPLQKRHVEVSNLLQTIGQIRDLQDKFNEQAKIFNCDWAAYIDEVLPRRLQFFIDGLRVRLANAHSSRVVNAVEHSEGASVAWNTTVGLRNPKSAWYGLGRDIVQWGGMDKMLATNKARMDIDNSIEDITSSLDYYESLMAYYYELCAEFKGKDRDGARRCRLLARCGYQDEKELPVLEEDVCEEELLFEKESLEKKIKWIKYKSGSKYAQRQGSIKRPACQVYKSKVWFSFMIFMFLVVFLAVASSWACCRIAM